SQGWLKLVPRRYQSFANTLFSDLKQGMNAYFRGQMLIAFCVGILYCIGFTIIDFPLAIPLGILIGVLSFIPYLHALGLIPAFILCVLKSAETGQNFWLVILSAALVFIIIQIIQDALLTPKIMGKAIGLPPFLILLSLSVWGFLLGIIGMIIALPLTTIIFSYYKRYISKTE
ncbi:MAG: AI-2E family transporter, partial [Bacteroidaceae bacterium]